MLKATGWRLLRLTVDRRKVHKLKVEDTAGHVRKACVRKGLVLASDGVNPSMPYRYRETRKEVFEIEQLQMGTGVIAGCPPEQPEFLERFLGGEAWGGVVKSATV